MAEHHRLAITHAGSPKPKTVLGQHRLIHATQYEAGIPSVAAERRIEDVFPDVPVNWQAKCCCR